MVKLNYEKNKLLRRGFIQIMSISLPSLILFVILLVTSNNLDDTTLKIITVTPIPVYAGLTNLIFWKIFPIKYIRLLNYVAYVDKSKVTDLNPNPNQIERIKERKFLKKSYFNKISVSCILIGLFLFISVYVLDILLTLAIDTPLFLLVFPAFFLPFSIGLFAFGIAMRMDLPHFVSSYCSTNEKAINKATCHNCGAMFAIILEGKVGPETDTVKYNTESESYTETVGTVYKDGEKVGDITRDATINYSQRVDIHSWTLKAHCANCGREKIIEEATYKYGDWVKR